MNIFKRTMGRLTCLLRGGHRWAEGTVTMTVEGKNEFGITDTEFRIRSCETCWAVQRKENGEWKDDALLTRIFRFGRHTRQPT